MKHVFYKIKIKQNKKKEEARFVKLEIKQSTAVAVRIELFYLFTLLLLLLLLYKKLHAFSKIISWNSYKKVKKDNIFHKRKVCVEIKKKLV